MKRNDSTRCDPTLPGDDYQSSQGQLATCDRDAKIASRNLSKQGLRIARTRVGKGIFATKSFHRQQLIGEIQGSLVCNSLGGSYYAFDLENGFLLEPDAPFRFINHSCEPNCRFDFFDNRLDGEQAEAKRRIFVFAARFIDVGSELTFDYQWDYDQAIPCRCQAATCRQWIVAKSQLQKCIAYNASL